MANDLLIKINADASNATKEFDNIKKQTEDLESTLKGVALVSGAAFAALTAEIFFSVKAFEDAQKSSIQLTNALQNQGIYTDELKSQYEEFATVVQAKTGIDNDAIIKSQAIAQSFLGQTKITEDLTFAIADLGASMGGDLNGAAEKIARTIGTSTNAFARQGLVLAEGLTEAERYAKVLEFVSTKAGGLASAFNEADGFTQALSTSFGNFQETLGARFAPAVAAARKAIIGFFDLFTNNPVLADFAASLLVAGTVVAGLITAASLAVPAFTAFTAAMAAFGVTANIALAGIPIVIGAIVAAVTFMALNWEDSMKAMTSAATVAVELISSLFSGLGQVLSGAFSLDPSQIKAGLDQITQAFVKAKNEVVATYSEITEENKKEQVIQEADKKQFADRIAANERRQQQNLVNIKKAEIDLLRLQNQNASEETIALKTEEIAVLKALNQEKTAEEMVLLEEKRAALLEMQDAQLEEDIQRVIEFDAILKQTKDELAATQGEADIALREEQLAKLRDETATKDSIDRDAQEMKIKRAQAVRATFLADEKTYGIAFAKINKALYSDEINAAGAAAGELVALSQSKNKALAAVGKAAAITQIGIDTAKGAMAVYANFQTAIPYPPVSIPLGIAAAAAVVAYGAERIGQVTGAQDGGIIEGGIPGRDSVPALLEPGELVVPRRNFNDVVGAVQGGGNVSNEEMLVTLRSIDSKISTPMTTIIQGDVMADDSFVDSLVRRISDSIEFRNGQIFGVTT